MRLMVLALGCVLAGSAWADEKPGSISTSATAHARLPNTVADVTVAVQAQAPDLASVQKTLTAGSERLVVYLQQQSVERLQTQGVSVTPDIDYGKNGANRIVGYSGQVRVMFRVPADRLGGVLAGALEHGGNAIDSTSLQPTQAALEATRRELETQAVRLALADVKAVAEAAGRKLGAVQEIKIGADGEPAYPRPMRAMAAAPAPGGAPAPPIATEAGETQVDATVSIRVALIEP